MADILDQIIARRKEDYARLGPTFGSVIPQNRERAVCSFLKENGAILEIKRASPSKGDIAPDLDPVALARSYGEAGARNVSVLTEMRYFKGSLDDLVLVSSRFPALSFLRKDFILYEDEIEVSFRAGADAVLLIARILDEKTLRSLAARCRSFGMTPFIEVREGEDVAKLTAAAKDGFLVAGVNSRDLATFRTDLLVPALLRTSLPCRTIFESGARNEGTCRFARQIGFDGILIGEAVAKNPQAAAGLVKSFLSAKPDWVGHFWRQIARRKNERRPLVKICGFTRVEDALFAASLGADVLGFVFAPSPRETKVSCVRETSAALDKLYGTATSRSTLPAPTTERPLMVGVVVDAVSPQAENAFALVCAGILDAIQYHGDHPERDLPLIDAAGGGYGIGRYTVVRLGGDEDLERLDALTGSGEPRVLVDARVEGIAGGTGKTIPRSLVKKAGERSPLWLAGGLGPANVRSCIEAFDPELIDASSALESEAGIKDQVLLKAFFREIDR